MSLTRKNTIQHLPLHKRRLLGKNFRIQAQYFVPLYRQQRHVINYDRQPDTEFASPVCYASLKGMREGFED